MGISILIWIEVIVLELSQIAKKITNKCQDQQLFLQTKNLNRKRSLIIRRK